MNLDTGSLHAVKIIKNKPEYTIQGLVEIKILRELFHEQARSQFEKQHIIEMQDHFVFRGFLCIVFELLDRSLYDVVSNTHGGLMLDQVREYCKQILEGLVTCKNANLIHCDLKPENILVHNQGKQVKLIDFGSAAFNGHQVYTYIQSRYYRAPEVLMGTQMLHTTADGQQIPVPAYDQSIDMWSLGCTAVELFIKTPIFPGKNDYDQMLKIMEFCGLPPQEMIMTSINRDRLFFFNPEQQRFNFKSFQHFVQSNYLPEAYHMVEQPQQIHDYRNINKLLEQYHYLKLRKTHAEQNPDFPFEYTKSEQRKIFEFIYFVMQIL